MEPGAWIALAGLGFTVLIQIVFLAFLFGGLFARMKAVESRPTDMDCKTELAVVKTELTGLKTAVADIADDIKNLTGRMIPARRSREA